MTCCAGTIAADAARNRSGADQAARTEALLHAGKQLDDGTLQYVLAVPSIHCGQCISTIERALKQVDGIAHARVNLTLKRLTVRLDQHAITIDTVIDTLAALGYPAQPVDLGDLEEVNRKRGDIQLLKALAVAGFASSNIMLLSVSVWSGAEGATRDLFHLISALIALPAVLYAGQVFYRSAFTALRAGRVNMDVPIALAITLATGMSLFEAMTGGEEAYFEASTMLLFFLLIGRYLDHRMRERARNAVVQLSKLSAKGATIVGADGTLEYRPLDELKPGMVMRVRPGERLPVDGKILSGTGDIDRSLVTGESLPVAAEQGLALEGGVLNLNGVLDIEITNTGDASFLAEVGQMMAAAENGHGAYVRLADRMARHYAPFVHGLAALAFVTWMIWTGGDWHTSLYVAIALLIITCPCALGLAVPVVHVIGAARLFESGILMKDGSALEKMAEIDRAVFDKTGTLTTGEPVVTSSGLQTRTERMAAASLGHASTHPAARAVARFFGGETMLALTDAREVPGCGVEATIKGRTARLGRREWVAQIAGETPAATAQTGGLSLAMEGAPLRLLTLGETLRDGAAGAINALKSDHIETMLLSGDAAGPVERIADTLGIDDWLANQRPADKIACVEALKASGHRVLFVGDGLNDAPALAAGDVSMAPSSGSDVGRTAADFVFTRDDLDAVAQAHRIALRSRSLIQQNFALAFAYNFIAVPIAFAGMVTPLVAALAMSASSIVVVANSMRLWQRKPTEVVPTRRASQPVPALQPAE